MLIGEGAVEADVTTGMGFKKDNSIRGVGGDIQWTDPKLVPPGGGLISWVYAYVGSRLDALGVGWWVKWGYKKNNSYTYKLHIEFRDNNGVVHKGNVSASIPLFLTYRNYDFHFYDSAGGNDRHEFFMNQTLQFVVNYGFASQQIPYQMGDMAFGGTDISIYSQEELRNPPDSNPPGLLHCYINYRELKYYRPSNSNPNVFVWKPWKETVLDAESYQTTPKQYYSSTSIADDAFITWNYEPGQGQGQDPCLTN